MAARDGALTFTPAEVGPSQPFETRAWLRHHRDRPTAPGALNKEDRIDLTFTLPGFGDWGPFGLR